MNLNEKHLLEGDSKSEVTGIGVHQQASPVLADSVTHLRIVDYLADIFIQVLSFRRLAWGNRKISDPLDGQTASQKTHTPHSSDVENLNSISTGSYLGLASGATPDQEAIVDSPIPRMDFTGFQIFFE